MCVREILYLCLVHPYIIETRFHETIVTLPVGKSLWYFLFCFVLFMQLKTEFYDMNTQCHSGLNFTKNGWLTVGRRQIHWQQEGKENKRPENWMNFSRVLKSPSIMVGVMVEREKQRPSVLAVQWIRGSDQETLSLFLFNCSAMSDSLRPHELQQARLPCPSPSPRICPNSHPLSWWCRPTILSSVEPFSSCV